MPNLRIISDNAAGRASLSASSTAGALGVAGLLADIKSDVWRATGTAESIDATWPSSEMIGAVFLPFCNLTSAATMRVRATIDGGLTYCYDSGIMTACPGGGASLRAWGNTPVGANAYGYGGGACARHWLPSQMPVTGITIDISGPGNPAGYVEAARLVVGSYWEPDYNADYGAPFTSVDNSKNYRTDAGDLMTDIGTRHRRQSLSLSAMTAADRAALAGILGENGMSIPVMLSLYPNSGDPALERAHQIYGKFMSSAAMSSPSYARYATQLEIEEI